MSHSPCLTKTPSKPRSFRVQKHLLMMSNPALKGRKTKYRAHSDLASQVCSYQWQRKVGFRPDIHSCLPERSSKERTFNKSSKCINKIHWIKLLSQQGLADPWLLVHWTWKTCVSLLWRLGFLSEKHAECFVQKKRLSGTSLLPRSKVLLILTLRD